MTTNAKKSMWEVYDVNTEFFDDDTHSEPRVINALLTNSYQFALYKQKEYIKEGKTELKKLNFKIVNEENLQSEDAKMVNIEYQHENQTILQTVIIKPSKQQYVPQCNN